MASWFRPRSLLQLQEKKESIPMLHNLTSVQPPGQGVGVSLVNGGMVILEASIGRRCALADPARSQAFSISGNTVKQVVTG